MFLCYTFYLFEQPIYKNEVCIRSSFKNKRNAVDSRLINCSKNSKIQMKKASQINTLYFFTKSLGVIAVTCLLFSCNNDAKNHTKNEKAATSKPNIIILLADDLGYGDLSCYGSQSIETPNIDSLAMEGMRFNNFYAGSAVCSPSRASLLTGKYPLRFNIRAHFDDDKAHLPESTTTLPEILKKDGYSTIHIGKWHLGGLRPMDYESRAANKKANPGPLQHGFDYYLSNIEGAPVRPMLINDRKLYREGGKYLVENDKRIKTINKHWTAIKVDEAIEQIDKSTSADKPFFLNLWFDAPHTPYEPAPEPHLSKYKKMGVTGDQLLFRSMVSYLDANIGRLVKHLKEKGIFDNTIIIFASDNGPAWQGSAGPFAGAKTDLHEGGMRVPMFAVWKNHIPADQLSFNVVHMSDMFPTIATIAGIDISNLKIDGKNELPAFLSNKFVPRNEPLYWQMDIYPEYQNQGPRPLPIATAAITNGKWKLLMLDKKPVALYDIKNDHRELYNVMKDNAKIVDELTAKLRGYLDAPRDSSGFRELGVNN